MKHIKLSTVIVFYEQYRSFYLFLEEEVSKTIHSSLVLKALYGNKCYLKIKVFPFFNGNRGFYYLNNKKKHIKKRGSKFSYKLFL